MQMLAGSWKIAKEQGHIIMPYSKLSKMSYVDYRDVAEVAALAMTGTELSYGTFELCSPGMYNGLEMAALIGDALGKTVEAGEISPENWLQQAHIPPGPLSNGLVAMNEEYDHYGFSGGNGLVLKTILGREPRTVKQFIQELKNGEKAKSVKYTHRHGNSV
jgi:nucleoside-diphosphate-sugar epimerase